MHRRFLYVQRKTRAQRFPKMERNGEQRLLFPLEGGRRRPALSFRYAKTTYLRTQSCQPLLLLFSLAGCFSDALSVIKALSLSGLAFSLPRAHQSKGAFQGQARTFCGVTAFWARGRF